MKFKVQSASIDEKNRNVLNVIFSDGTKTFVCIPPGEGNRLDIILQKDLKEGYNFGAECIVIIKKDGETEIIISNNG